jgi:hypothetical protein
MTTEEFLKGVRNLSMLERFDQLNFSQDSDFSMG